MNGGRFLEFASFILRALGLDGLDVSFEQVDAPGGDERNIAFVRAGPDLRMFEVEYNIADCDEREVRIAVIHESLHIALRHVGGLHRTMKDRGVLWAPLLEQALEEDTEALAVALDGVLADVPMFAVEASS